MGPRTLASLATLAALVLAGCAGPAAPPAPLDLDGPRVDMARIKFAPPNLTVEAGARVTWVNLDETFHTVTPTDKAHWASEGSKVVEQGGTWAFAFAAPGSYDYYCIPHASRDGDGTWRGMVGRVTVLAAGAGSPGGPGNATTG